MGYSHVALPGANPAKGSGLVKGKGMRAPSSKDRNQHSAEESNPV